MEDFEKIYSEYYDVVFGYVLTLCCSEDLAEDDIERQLIRKDDAFCLHGLLYAMGEPYKEVFWMRTFGELSFGEIGAIFGKTESWARVTYHRARLKLKEGINELSV